MSTQLRTDADIEDGPHARASWRAVVVPREHGGWGLTLEPVVLGLLVAPSLAGAAIGAAAVLAFVAHTPLRVVLVDHHHHRVLARTTLARRVAIGEFAVILTLLGVAAILAAGPFWVPLIAALPLIGVELWFDLRSRSRRLAPELAGTIGIGSVAAAIVLASNGSPPLAAALAAGLWVVIGARAVASIPFVRLQLQRAKNQPYRRSTSDVAQAVALLLVIAAWLPGWLPAAAVIVIGALGIAQIVLARTPPLRAVLVGAQQVVFGLAVVIVTAVAVRAG